jgi:hypothetical protein
MEVTMSLEEIYAGSVKEGNQLIEVTVTGTGVQYFAEGLKGADPEAAAFKCWAVFPVTGAGVTGRHVRHAEGLHAPGWNGANLANLTYLPEEEEE